MRVQATFLRNSAVEVVLVELMRRWWSRDSLWGVINGVRSVRRSSSGMGDGEGRRDRMVEREVSSMAITVKQGQSTEWILSKWHSCFGLTGFPVTSFPVTHYISTRTTNHTPTFKRISDENNPLIRTRSNELIRIKNRFDQSDRMLKFWTKVNPGILASIAQILGLRHTPEKGPLSRQETRLHRKVGNG